MSGNVMHVINAWLWECGVFAYVVRGRVRYFVGWLAVVFVCWCGSWVVVLLVGGWVGWLVGWLFGWLGGWWVGWLVGWLAGWLVGRLDGCYAADEAPWVAVGWRRRFPH